MYEFIASIMPRRLVRAAFHRVVNHCIRSDDQEIQADARYTSNAAIQWGRVIDGEVEENR